MSPTKMTEVSELLDELDLAASNAISRSFSRIESLELTRVRSLLGQLREAVTDTQSGNAA